jgi:thiamine biosynthesis lipoprotein
LLRRARPLLGTLVSIELDEDGDDAALNAAFERIAQVHAAMSFHEPGSDLRRLARANAGELLELGADTHAVLALATRLEAESEGAFNPCCAAALVERGLLPRPVDGKPPGAGRLGEALELLDDGRSVRLRATPWIDLGGVAKGYAVDAAVEALRSAGVSSGLVNAGGDLRAFGPRAVNVQVRDPRHPGQCLNLAELSDMACATTAWLLSGTGPRSAAHLVAPPQATALGDNAPMSVTVFAPRCAIADALTKVVWLRGAAAGPLLRSHDAHAFVWYESGASERL